MIRRVIDDVSRAGGIVPQNILECCDLSPLGVTGDLSQTEAEWHLT